ncbi:MAG: hypothetical protein JWP89_3827 [Schlesneria sp.]|nr:hypothetical protein [Schlesneria sp.]
MRPNAILSHRIALKTAYCVLRTEYSALKYYPSLQSYTLSRLVVSCIGGNLVSRPPI